jgi:hypothetical protein
VIPQGTIEAPVTLKDAERAHILPALRASNGVIASTALRLGLPRSTLFYKMRRLGISVPREVKHRLVVQAFPARGGRVMGAAGASSGGGYGDSSVG